MSDLLPVSREEKIACLRRELGMRGRVYPKWVLDGKMKAPAAEKEIRVMAAILKDYESSVGP